MKTYRSGKREKSLSGRLLRTLFLAVAAAVVAFAVYVAVADLPAPQREIVREAPNDLLLPR